MGLLPKLRQTLSDVSEREEILTTTSLPRLYWISTYRLRTAERSGILIQSPGQENVSLVFHAEDFTPSKHGGYDVYGLHMGQTDVLTFLATDNRIMMGHFVDCRRNSTTLHQDVVLEFGGDPDRALVIERGIAHIFDNLVGIVTLNQPRLYWDYANPDFNSAVDVLNVPRDTAIDRFPEVRVNRYRAPRWLCSLARKSQRMQLRAGRNTHPFRFVVQGKTITFVPQDSSTT